MMRRFFKQDLQRLNEDVLALGSMVEEALLDSVDLLLARDRQGARLLIASDRMIDRRRYAIEADALRLIAMQQPMAGDMRFLAAVLFIAGELERIGDYARGISRVNLKIGDELLMKPSVRIPPMAEIGHQMLQLSLDSFTSRDTALARVVMNRDEEVDSLYNQIHAELITSIVQDPSRMRQATMLLMVAHNLERAADRTINICERVVYCVTGKLVDPYLEDTNSA